MGGEAESIGIAEARSALALVARRRRRRRRSGRTARLAEAAPPREQPCRKPAAPPRTSPSRPTKPSPTSKLGWRAACSCRSHPRPRQADPAARPRKCRDHAAQRRADARGCRRRPADRRRGWELTQRMLAAIDIAADQAYSASLSCFHAPGARMTPAGPRSLRRDRAAPHRAGQAEAPAAVRRRPVARRCSASRCSRRAAMSTRSKASAPSRPSIPAS